MKRKDPRRDGRWRGPPETLWAELEKIALLRAWEEIPKFPDAEEIALKAMALLLARWLIGKRPRHPKAWLRRAVSRLAWEWKKSQKSRTASLDRRREERGEDLDERMDLRRRSPEYQRWLEEAREKVLELLRDWATPRQWDALNGILRTRTLADAAREAGLSKRDLGQAEKELRAKGKKIQKNPRKFSPPPP